MDKIDRILAGLDTRIADVDRLIERGPGADEAPRQAPMTPKPPASPGGALTRGKVSQGVRLGLLERPVLSMESDVSRGLTTSPRELVQLVAYVTHSAHVQNNASYAPLAAQVHFVPDLENPQVNAYATYIADEHGGRGMIPLIVLLGGAVTFARLVSIAATADQVLAAGQPPHYLKLLITTLGTHLLKSQCTLPAKSAQAIAARCGLLQALENDQVARRARDFAAGLNIGIIAHELGHHVLGHTAGQAANNEVSRNQEREADSFASSVISSSPFGTYLVAGTILWELVWVWCDQVVGNSEGTTHPLAKERLMDFIRANAATAAELGITEQQIGDFLPKP